MRETPTRYMPWLLTLATLAWLASCDDRAREIGEGGGSPSAPSAGAGHAERRASDDRYTLEASPSSLDIDDQTTVTLTIRAGDGLEPNQKFPAWSLDLTPPEGGSLKTTSWSREDFTLDKERASVRVPVSAAREGGLELRGRATFSVCNDQTCHVLRDEPVAFELSTNTDQS